MQLPQEIGGERQPLNTEWSDELVKLNLILGKPKEQLPGDIERNQKGEFKFKEGTLTETELVKRITDALKDKKVENFSELTGVLQDLSMMRSLQVTAELNRASNPADQQRLKRELIVSNQGAAYYEYLPEVVRQIGETFDRYEALRQLGRKLNLPLPKNFDSFEKNTTQYVKVLRETLDYRVRFGNAVQFRDQIRLQRNMPALKQTIDRLSIIPQRNADQERELSRARLDYSIAEQLGLETATSQELQRPFEEALMALQPADRTLLTTGTAEAQSVRTNELNQKIVDILAGDKKATGLDQDFVPQTAYIELWQEFDKDLLTVQRELEKTFSKEEPKKIEDQKQYLHNIRRQMSGDLTAFVNDLGQYQLELDEIARTQHHIGHSMTTLGVTAPLNATAPKDAEGLQNWLDERAKFRQNAIRGSLDEASKMLEPGTMENIEDAWTKNGQVIVADVAVKLSRIAAGWLPSEKGTAMNIIDKTYNKAAPLVGLPEVKSNEKMKDELSGPILEVLGWPKDKTWAELNDAEKMEIKKRTKSVLDAMNNFDRSKINNLRQTMSLIDEFQQKNPPSSFANEPVSEDVLQAMEGQRVGADMTGQVVAGVTVNKATAFILLLRQRRKDWGDPEQKTGFIGEYAKFLDGLDDNVKLHLDTAGALFKMQRAYWEYSKDLMKFAGLAALSPWIIAAIMAAGPTVYKVGRFAAPRLYRGAVNTTRATWNALRGVRESTTLSKETQGALQKMRYLAKERQVAQWLESTRAGQTISKLGFLREARLVRGGAAVMRGTGVVFKYGTSTIIPAMAAVEAYYTHQRVKGAEGNAELQNTYRDNYYTTALEAGGLMATMPLSVGPQIVLAAPVLYAADYRRARNEVSADWTRGIDNWMNEYDSAGLMGKLRDTNLSNAVEAGGGGALYPRIAFPSKEDQIKAANTIDSAQIGARASIMEAYFKKNLLAPADATELERQDFIRHKLIYMKMITQGRFERPLNSAYEQADLYAELMLRRKQMEKAGEPLLLSYITDEGDRRWIDLSKISQGSAPDGEIVMAVMEYANNIRSGEEVAMFSTMGNLGKKGNLEERQSAWQGIRQSLLSKLSHHLHIADSYIPSVDWPGVDVVLVSSGNAKAINVIRSYLAGSIEARVNNLANGLYEGSITVEKYNAVLEECKTILNQVAVAVEDKKTDALYKRAAAYFGENLGDAEKYANGITRLLDPTNKSDGAPR